MEASVKKSIFLQALKAGLLSLVFSCVSVLLLALIAKLTGLGGNVLPIINQVLKVIAVALGTAIGVKQEKFLAKALIGALIFWLLSFGVFAAIGGKFNVGQIALDLVISLAVAAVVAFVKIRKA